MVKETSAAGTHHVEGFYSSDARTWILRTGIDPAGPASGARLRRWETLGIVQRVNQVSLYSVIYYSFTLPVKSDTHEHSR